MTENHSFGCIEDQVAMGLHDLSKAEVYHKPKEMTDEEYFRKCYPDSCYGDKPLSPHWDFFQDGIEFGERQSEKKIKELEAQIEKMKNCKNCANYMISGKCPSFFRTGWCKNWEMTK